MSHPQRETPERRELRIEARAKELLEAYMASLILDSSGSSESSPWPAWNCSSAVNDIKREHWLPIARAIIKKDYEVLGRLIVLGVIETLTEDAEYAAENEPY